MKAIQKVAKIGRPTKYSRGTLKKLQQAFEIGANVKEACSVAKITETTYYEWVRDIAGFSVAMTQSQAYSDLFAKKNVAKSIIDDKNLETSKWWLEKRQYNNKDIIGIETSDGDKTTRFIITRGNPNNEPIADNSVPLPTTLSTQKDGETLST